MSDIGDEKCVAYAKLWFDGSASENPGPAAWGVRITLEVVATGHYDELTRGAPIGHATNNVAEYFGLISGLRQLESLLQSESIQHSLVDVEVYGDSQLVINQMTGAYRVRSPDLITLHTVAKHLATRFYAIEFSHCSREHNQIADRLAKQACDAPFSPENKAIYYPALTNFVDVWFGKHHTLGSHDVLTAGSDPSLFIDAGFLYNLPGGKQMLGNIRDCYPLSVVVGKVDMAVLGFITADIGVSFSRRRRAQPDNGPRETSLVDIVVVHKLPVPIHVSIRHRDMIVPEEIRIGGGIRFTKDNLPASYSNHPYWGDNGVIFIGGDYGLG